MLVRGEYDSMHLCKCFSEVSVQVCIIYMPVNVDIYTLSPPVFLSPLQENTLVCAFTYVCVFVTCVCIMHVYCVYELSCDFKLQVQMHHLPLGVKISCSPQRKYNLKWNTVLLNINCVFPCSLPCESFIFQCFIYTDAARTV